MSKCTILNPPQSVALASDKLQAFRTMNPERKATRRVRVAGQVHDVQADHDLFQGVGDNFVGAFPHPRYGVCDIMDPAPKVGVNIRTPEFTTDKYVAMNWIQKGFTVVERHILNGNSGAGIRLVEPPAPGQPLAEENMIQKCPLYVKYVPKKQEYRIHVCGGEAVDVQRKARRKDVADDAINWKIRNHDNGFIFARNEDGLIPPDVIEQAVSAVGVLGLDFGAVDVIFNDKEQKAYVLEVNTAPGLAGETLAGYLKRFTGYINGEVALPNRDVPKAFVGDQEIPKVAVAQGVRAGALPNAIKIDPMRWLDAALKAPAGAEPEVW
ncbi:hypothetical protein D3C71_885220 [compost metagenome]